MAQSLTSQSLPTSAGARKMALWVPTSCAEVDVEVQQILGVSVVERPLCVEAFAPVADVPPPCCPSCVLAPQSLSLWTSL